MQQTHRLETEFEEAATQARNLLARITAQAQREGDRRFTDTERQSIEAAISRAQRLRDQLRAGQGAESFNTALAQLGGGMTGDPLIAGPSIGAQYARQYSTWQQANRNRSGRWEAPLVECTDPRGFGMFATTITEGGTGGLVPVPDYQPGIVPIPLRPPVVADLLSGGPTSSNAIVYLAEKTITNAAATVAEGAAKPESAITFEQRTDPVQKIAHWIPVTDELLDDVPAMRTYIDTRLMQGVQVVEDDQLMSGSGVAPNILGLLNRPGLAADVARVDPDTNADAIAKQMAAIQTATTLVPTGVIMHPTNWLTCLLTKTTQGAYIGASPFAPPQVPTLWGKPVAITKAIAAGTALVVCGQAATVFRRGGLNVQASNSHQDFFVKNLTAVRCEERLALAVMIAAAFGKVTGLN